MINGYDFYFDTKYGLLTLPITPSELNIKNSSNNKTVTLINEGEVNILHSPSLIEVEFEARFPMRKYPFARTATIRMDDGEYRSFDSFGMFNAIYDNYTKEQIPYEFTPQSFYHYWGIIEKLKEEKTPFRFIVARTTPKGDRTWDTNLVVSLEDLETNESADEGDDVIVSFKLKQYKEYGVKFLPSTEKPKTTSTAQTQRDTNSKSTSQQTYTVKPGDCLWNIAKAAYGDGSKWTVIYNSNKTVIENAAKQHGKSSSSNGHWIYPGTVLVIPDANTANLNVQKLSSSSSSGSTSSSSTSKNNQTYILSVNVSGSMSYAGKIHVNYYNSNKERVTLSGKTSSFSLICYKGTQATVIIAPNKEGHSFKVTSKSGTWSSSTYSSSCTMNKHSSITISWVR